MTIEQKIMKLREFPVKDLNREIKRTLQVKTTDPTILHSRALFVTGLREAKLWPAVYRGKR